VPPIASPTTPSWYKSDVAPERSTVRTEMIAVTTIAPSRMTRPVRRLPDGLRHSPIARPMMSVYAASDLLLA
jgi:hypothetical protein